MRPGAVSYHSPSVETKETFHYLPEIGSTTRDAPFRGLLHFDDGSELHIREFVDISTGIERYKYSYHYMRAGHLMFRYDN